MATYKKIKAEHMTEKQKMIQQADIRTLNKYDTNYDVTIHWEYDKKNHKNPVAILWYICIIKKDGACEPLFTKYSELRYFKNLETALNFVDTICTKAKVISLDANGLFLAKKASKEKSKPNLIKIN